MRVTSGSQGRVGKRKSLGLPEPNLTNHAPAHMASGERESQEIGKRRAGRGIKVKGI